LAGRSARSTRGGLAAWLKDGQPAQVAHSSTVGATCSSRRAPAVELVPVVVVVAASDGSASAGELRSAGSWQQGGARRGVRQGRQRELALTRVARAEA
jgi:hypothetical protein